MRSPLPQELEKKISGANNIKQIRQACDTSPELESALMDGMQPVKTLLESLFVRLKLKEKPFKVFHAASSEEIDALWSHVLRVDNQLLRQDTSSRVVRHRPGLKMFLEHCCQERSYCFSIKKCGTITCSICSPPQLPVEVFNTLHHLPDPVPDITGEHYQDFEQLYGTATSDHP